MKYNLSQRPGAPEPGEELPVHNCPHLVESPPLDQDPRSVPGNT